MWVAVDKERAAALRSWAPIPHRARLFWPETKKRSLKFFCFFFIPNKQNQGCRAPFAAACDCVAEQVTHRRTGLRANTHTHTRKFISKQRCLYTQQQQQQPATKRPKITGTCCSNRNVSNEAKLERFLGNGNFNHKPQQRPRKQLHSKQCSVYSERLVNTQWMCVCMCVCVFLCFFSLCFYFFFHALRTV